MNKKGVIIIALALGLAGVLGAVTYHNVVSKNELAAVGAQGSTAVTVAAADQADDSDSQNDSSSLQEETQADNQADDSETVAPDNTDSTYYQEVVSTSFKIKRVVDHTNGDECSPREVFGSSYYSLYLNFDSDFNFELYLDMSTEEARHGSYEIYGDTISVVYDDGVGSEYRVLLNDAGGIEYIIVNFGDYDVYFG